MARKSREVEHGVNDKRMELWQQGLSDGQIAAAIDSSVSSVMSWRYRHKLDANPPAKRKPEIDPAEAPGEVTVSYIKIDAEQFAQAATELVAEVEPEPEPVAEAVQVVEPVAVTAEAVAEVVAEPIHNILDLGDLEPVEGQPQSIAAISVTRSGINLYKATVLQAPEEYQDGGKAFIRLSRDGKVIAIIPDPSGTHKLCRKEGGHTCSAVHVLAKLNSMGIKMPAKYAAEWDICRLDGKNVGAWTGRLIG